MSRCRGCEARVEGSWARCPLCGTELEPLTDGTGPGSPRPSEPFPAVALRYSGRRVLRVLLLVSLGMVIASFALQLLLPHTESGWGWLRASWLGLATTWLLVLIALRERRNLARATAYLVVLVGLVSAYWDYLTGWHAWSLTYTVPIVCGSSIIAVLVLVRVRRMEPGDHVLYAALTIAVGLVPLLFLVLGWVTTPLPSLLCAALALAQVTVSRGREVLRELSRRLHL